MNTTIENEVEVKKPVDYTWIKEVLLKKEIMKALYTCASKEDSRQALAGFFILPDRKVFSTDGRRLVIIEDDQFESLEPGNYEFKSKPEYLKNGLAMVMLGKNDYQAPNIEMVLKGLDKVKVCSHVFELDKSNKAISLTSFICKVVTKTGSGINYDLLDFLPGEVFNATTKEGNIEGAPIMLSGAFGSTKMTAVITIFSVLLFICFL